MTIICTSWKWHNTIFIYDIEDTANHFKPFHVFLSFFLLIFWYGKYKRTIHFKKTKKDFCGNILQSLTIIQIFILK